MLRSKRLLKWKTLPEGEYLLKFYNKAGFQKLGAHSYVYTKCAFKASVRYVRKNVPAKKNNAFRFYKAHMFNFIAKLVCILEIKN